MRAFNRWFRELPVPVSLTLLAALLSALLGSLGPRLSFGLFIAAVMVSAWWGGLRAAGVATAGSAVALALLQQLLTAGPRTETSEDHFLRLGLFILVGLLAGYVSQQCRQAIRAVDQLHDILTGNGLGLITADTSGRVKSLNALVGSLTGWHDQEAAGEPLERVFRIVRPHREALVLPIAEILLWPNPYELPEGTLLLTPHGGETAVEGTVSVVRGSDGQASGLMVVFRTAGERVQALQTAQEKAERFGALAGHAPIPLLVLDAQGKCTYANPAAQAGCDCTAEECLGEGWARHVLPEDRAGVLADWATALAEKQPFAGEFCIEVPNSEPRRFRLRSSPMLGETGQVVGQVAMLEDVTERHRAEADLERCEEEWAARLVEEQTRHQAAEAGHRAVEKQLRDQVDHLQALGRQGEEALQAVREEFERLLQQHTASCREAEEMRERAQDEFRQKLGQVQADRQQAQDELRQIREDLAQRAGAHERALQQLQDIHREILQLRQETEAARQAEEDSRRAKEFLEAVIASSPEGLWAHDRDGRCRLWNPRLEEWFHKTSAEALGRRMSELFPAPSENGQEEKERLETVAAPVRTASGDTIGGMAVVRRIRPETSSFRKDEEPATPLPRPHVQIHSDRETLATDEEGQSPEVSPARHREVDPLSSLGEMDWLSFN